MGPRHLNLKGRPVATPTATYDAWLLLATVGLIALGLTMVASSSIMMSQQHFGYAFYFLLRQVIFLGAGLFLGFTIIRIPSEYWSRLSGMIFLLGLLFLALVLVPGIGRSVNGSTRWIGIGMVGMQVSEFAKLAVIIYMASYLTRYQEEVEGRVSGFLKPLLLLGLVGALLLMEPDWRDSRDLLYGARNDVFSRRSFTAFYYLADRLRQFGAVFSAVLALPLTTLNHVFKSLDLPI